MIYDKGWEHASAIRIVIVVHLTVATYVKTQASHLRVTVLDAPCDGTHDIPAILRSLFYHEFAELAHLVHERAIYQDFGGNVYFCGDSA